MPRHESVTNEYVAELKAKYNDEVERVKIASDWPETQKRTVTGTHPYLVALDRVDQGWSREEIATELGIRTGFGEFPGPISVIGNRQIDENAERSSPK
jgi:ribosome-binding protein aMBF1 (putative translation factor)